MLCLCRVWWWGVLVLVWGAFPLLLALPLSPHNSTHKYPHHYNRTYSSYNSEKGKSSNPWKSAMSRAKFTEISRQTFKALKGEIYTGHTLSSTDSKESPDSNSRDPSMGMGLAPYEGGSLGPRNPLWPDYQHLKKSRKQSFLRRQHRQRNRKKEKKRVDRHKLPNRRQAFQIATEQIMKGRKQSLCKTGLLKQRVRVEGCLPKIVINRFCFGQCESFFIPKTRRRKLKPAFQSCSACLPVDFSPVLVSFRCPTPLHPGNIVRRTVLKVKECACKALSLQYQ